MKAMQAVDGPSPFRSRVKIFLDGADRASLLEMLKNPQVRGFTTNPTLVKKAGVKDYRGFCQEILGQIRGRPISFEVFADEYSEMKRQAIEIASWAKTRNGVQDQVYVKIPVINSLGESSAPLIRDLSHQSIRLNVTAVYTLGQVQEVTQALKGGAPSLLSVFAGRIADTGRDPLPLMKAALEVCDQTDRNIELLWASTREALNIVQADVIGCPIITAPADVIKKMSSFNKDLIQLSLETVKTFKTDADSAGFSL